MTKFYTLTINKEDFDEYKPYFNEISDSYDDMIELTINDKVSADKEARYLEAMGADFQYMRVFENNGTLFETYEYVA